MGMIRLLCNNAEYGPIHTTAIMVRCDRFDTLYDIVLWCVNNFGVVCGFKDERWAYNKASDNPPPGPGHYPPPGIPLEYRAQFYFHNESDIVLFKLTWDEL